HGGERQKHSGSVPRRIAMARCSLRETLQPKLCAAYQGTAESHSSSSRLSRELSTPGRGGPDLLFIDPSLYRHGILYFPNRDGGTRLPFPAQCVFGATWLSTR